MINLKPPTYRPIGYKPRTLLPIDERDWKRIKKMLERIKVNRGLTSNYAFLCFGSSITIFISYIFFASQSKLNVIELIIGIALLLLFLVTGFFLLKIHRKEKQFETISANDVLEEIENIESEFIKMAYIDEVMQ